MNARQRKKEAAKQAAAQRRWEEMWAARLASPVPLLPISDDLLRDSRFDLSAALAWCGVGQ